METAAYWIALLTVIAFPPFLLLWFVVHPFAPLWRRLGPACAYAVAGSIIAAIMLAMYLIRGPLLRIRFGVRWPLACLAVPFLLAGLYIGVRRFRLLTPSIMFGLGGIFTEVYKDVTFRVVPISRYDATQMIGELKASVMFQKAGFRGMKVNRDALIDMLLRLSKLSQHFGEKIEQMDLNPVFAREDDAVVVDAKLILR